MVDHGTDTVLSSENKLLKTDRLVALWALSEAALGGLLHALRIPLTGLFVNSTAVLLMVLIAFYTDKKGHILRATLVVLIVKGIVSPHTPLNAYFAVAFQGLAGELLLRSKKMLLPSALALGVITLLQSAIQKVIVLTVVFGNTLWESIDIFGNFVLGQFFPDSASSGELAFSYWLIAAYIGVHLLTGILIGLLAARLPVWLTRELDRISERQPLEDIHLQTSWTPRRKRKGWFRRASGIAIVGLALVLVIASYLFPQISLSQGQKAILMILRSVIIMFLWFKLLSPFLLKMYRKYLSKKQNVYASEVEQAVAMMMPLRRMVHRAWTDTRQLTGLKRYRQFILSGLIYILTAEIKGEGNDPDLFRTDQQR